MTCFQVFTKAQSKAETLKKKRNVFVLSVYFITRNRASSLLLVHVCRPTCSPGLSAGRHLKVREELKSRGGAITSFIPDGLVVVLEEEDEEEDKIVLTSVQSDG